MPDSGYLIKERNPLLMLHIIDIDINKEERSSAPLPEFLFALGVGFPETGEKNKTASYVVNLVELRNWMDLDEDEDE